MEFPFHFGQKSSLLLIFFFHGIVFSVLLLRKGITHQNKSNTWLSLLLFLCSLYIAPYMLGYANWYASKVTREILFFVPFMQVLIIGPVVFFYIKSLLSSNFKFEKRDWLHFVPGFLYLIYSVVIFITDKLVLEEFYFYADGRDKDLKAWYQITGLLSIVIYLSLSLKKYFAYKKAIFNTVSYADTILFKWIQNFLFAFLSLVILRVLFFIFNEQWTQFGSHFWYFISFSMVFFYIALNGYSHAVKSSVLILDKVEEEVLSIEDNSKASSIDVSFWKEKLEQLISEKKIYTNPKLTLTNVAEALETNAKNISTTINTSFNMNFNDFINHYRVEAVKEKIHKKKHISSTLLGIALDSGFNSKATFNRAFKKSTSQTPKEYINSLK